MRSKVWGSGARIDPNFPQFQNIKLDALEIVSSNITMEFKRKVFLIGLYVLHIIHHFILNIVKMLLKFKEKLMIFRGNNVKLSE